MAKMRVGLPSLLLALGRCVTATTLSFYSPGNPILADGSYYSADPGPIVYNDTLYIISGQDSAPVGDNSFVINDWFLFSTSNPNPSGSNWKIQTNFLLPHTLFNWAAPGGAYASQIVQGPDKRFYVYSPVVQASTNSSDPFAIGVGVADAITGPYVDHHPSGPIVSQSYPAPGNNIENIDPTVYVDDDGKVYMYWGTFGALKGVELQQDMATFVGTPFDVTSLNGFFEASWLTKRNGTYYLIYADNSAGPDSQCTPTVYHACLAYGTASSPLGPWTYQGVILGIVSSTTSHSGVVKYKDQWYLVYHTADAKGGGNFRRSLAYDKLFFDDSTSPPSILPVKQTFRPAPPPQPTYDRGQLANATANVNCSIVYWIKAVNDLQVPINPLPPQYWSSFAYADSAKQVVMTYEWNQTVHINSTSMVFFADHPAGAVEGVAPPTSWSVQYLTSAGKWAAVKNTTAYSLEVTNTPKPTYFHAVNTTSLRATLLAPTNGTSTAGLGIVEWFVKSPESRLIKNGIVQ